MIRALLTLLLGALICAPLEAQVPSLPGFYTFTGIIGSTGTAVQLVKQGTSTVANQYLQNGLSCFVISSGSNKLSIGASNAVTNPQSVSFGTSAIGAYLVNGQGWASGVNNVNLIWINGTSGDGVTCWGN
jgi:hypothetical protein